MRKQEEYKEDQSEHKDIEISSNELPIVASARTGLAGKDDSIMRRVPVDYSGKSVREALDYIISADLNDSELPLGESIRRELNANGSIVVVNGKTAKLDDKLDNYLITSEHNLPNGSVRRYRQLDIEVSAVQQGGLYD